MTIQLLATKLSLPPLRSRLVARSKLLERLNTSFLVQHGFGRQLTLFSAPAGYGKTTLAIDWINSIPSQPVIGISAAVRIAWLSLDEADNDPRRFSAYLIAALKQVDESIGQRATAMLQSPQPPSDQVLLTSLVNEISNVSSPIIIVLDDYHVIHTLPIHQQLAFLLDHQPENLHLVVVTREDPLLPIPRLRARGQLLEIRQEDLRFSAEESADFLKHVMGLSLSPEEISALERRTEGWVAGLQLAALSMQGRDDLPGFVQAFTGSSRFILDYLIEEVFERQSPDVKDFLLKTSILERLSGPLCDAMAERNDSQNLLEGMEQANLFIVPLDQSRVWYRYHRLFAELLRNRLRVKYPAVEAKLHLRASQWFEAQGLITEAIQHALEAKDWEHAQALLQHESGEMLKRGEVATLIRWYQSFPGEMMQSDPKLSFDYCWPLILAEQYETAQPLLTRIEKTVENIPDFLGEVYAAQAYLARGQSDFPLMVEKSQQALGLLPKSAHNTRAVVATNLGLAYWHMGQMQAAEKVLPEALELGQATGNHYGAMTALIFLGRVYAVRGQLHQAREYFERAVQQGGDIPINALAYMDLFTLHYEWNELEASERHLQKAISLNQHAHNNEFLTACWMMLSRLRIAQGNIPGAEDALSKAWELVKKGGIPAGTADRLDAAQVELLLAKGAAVGSWGEKLTEKVDCHPFYRFLGLTKAKTLPDVHSRIYLNGLSQAAQANEWIYGLIAVRAMQAVKAEGREEAIGFLTDALKLAEGEGYIRSFVDAGEKLVPLLREAAVRGVSPDYVGRILAAMVEKTEKVGAGVEFIVEPLSEREIEVLRLVTAGMSNREIAEQLVISMGTAKTHVHNLCGKLGVRNRTEAATRAMEMKLV